MTRKDYIKAAELIKTEFSGEAPQEKERTIAVFVQFFRQDNPRFNEDRFRSACE
jgi:hypothetical protein